MVDEAGRAALVPLVRRLGFLHDRLTVLAPEVVRVTWIVAAGQLAVMSTRQALGEHDYPLDIVVQLPALAGPPDLHESFDVPMHGSEADGERVVFSSEGSRTFTQGLRRELALTARLVMAGPLPLRDEEAWAAFDGGSHEQRVTRVLSAGAHGERTGQYVRLIATALSGPLALDDEYVEALCLYAPLHDVGELDVPTDILEKPGKLDAQQWERMKAHTSDGARLVSAMLAEAGFEDLPRPDVLRTIVELHHESLDGLGYPLGLVRDEIPLEARIVTVADVFDALTHSRPYQPGWPVARALDEMDRMVSSGTIDGRCLTALATQLDALEVLIARLAGKEGAHEQLQA